MFNHKTVVDFPVLISSSGSYWDPQTPVWKHLC